MLQNVEHAEHEEALQIVYCIYKKNNIWTKHTNKTRTEMFKPIIKKGEYRRTTRNSQKKEHVLTHQF